MDSVGITQVYNFMPVNAALCSSLAVTCWSRRRKAFPSTTPTSTHTLTWAMVLGNTSEYFWFYILCGHM